MKEKRSKTQKINKKIVKTVLWLGITFFVLLLLLVTVVQIPYVQTRVLQHFSQVISKHTGFQTSIHRVNIKWFDTAVLDSIAIYDEEQCPMILIDQLTVDFDVRSAWNNGDIYLDEAQVNHGALYLLKDSTTNTLNITSFIDRVKELTRKKNKPPSERYPLFTIQEVHLRNVKFSYYDKSKAIITDRFDYHHFSLDSIHADVNDLRIISDTLEINVEQLSGYESVHNVKVHNFRGGYWFSNQTMAFENFEMRLGQSVLRDSVVFRYNSKNSLGYFNDSVTVEARLRNTRVSTQDLALFAPSLEQYRDTYVATGNFSGKVTDFTIRRLALTFGRNSRMAGMVSFSGLPEFQETFIDLELKNSTVQPEDLRQYIDDEQAYQNARKFGLVTFNTQFLGFPDDFVANGTFNTQLGNIQSDINLKLKDTPIYSGNLALQDFDLGTLTQRPDLLQKTSFNGFIEGTGVTLEDANFNLRASFNYLEVNDYTYRNITTDATLSRSFFEGQLRIEDPNLRFDGNGTVDLRDGKEDIRIQAELDTAFLRPLNLSKNDVFISTRLTADTQGLEVDNLVGDAQFEDMFVSYNERQLGIDTLWFRSRLAGPFRNFTLGTERINATLIGEFQFTKLFSDIGRLINEYRLIFKNDKEQLAAYYAAQEARTMAQYQEEQYEISYDLKFDDINPLLNLFVPEVTLSRNVEADGRMTGGYTNIVSLRSRIDTLQYRGYQLYGNTIDVTTSKIADSTDVLAMAYFHSEKQNLKIGKVDTPTKDFTLNAVWADGHIDFQQSIEQRDTRNYANVSGELTFLEDSTLIHFNPSELQVLNDHWFFSDNNRIVIANEEVAFSDFRLSHQSRGEETQSVSVIGTLSPDRQKQLTLRIDHFQVNNLNSILKKDFQGEINGFADLRNVFASSQDTTSNVMIESELSVRDLTIDTFEVGSIISLVSWNQQRRLLDINVAVNRKNRRIIALKGSYDPKEAEDQLRLRATFQDANLDIIEPFVDQYFSELAGTASGNFNVTGRLRSPILRGNGHIADGNLKINYLNTTYRIDGGLFLDDNTIGVKDLILLDSRNQRAVFNGGVFHDGFSDFVLDLNGTLDNVTVLNTSLTDNDLFYGNAYATGTVSLLGSVNNLNISARAKTDKGTKFYIPVGGVEGVEQSDFIRFVDYTDTTLTVNDSIGKINLTGLSLDLEIEVTPDAYGEIIFDAKTGDIIRGRGEGQLQMLISSAGDFSMFGDLTLQEGGYNFTLYNIINKEFTIQPGSSISWQGDPYEGVLNIQATYDQMASLAPLVLDEQAKETDEEVRRKYKAEVLLDLTGDLMSPTIDFGIAIDNYPENNLALRTAVETLKTSATLDTEELKRQVFSLIVLRRFSERGSFDGSNAVSGSVSELLSNQFSYWLSQVDENLEIDVDLGSFDDDRFNTFQLRLSYTLFDGRLRVTRDGGFTDINNQTSPASVIGDVTVEYLLTADGKYRVKMYNRSNYNALTQAFQGFTSSQGISLQYIEGFDSVSELLADTRDRVIQRRKKPTDEPVSPVSTSPEEEFPKKQAENRYTTPEE